MSNEKQKKCCLSTFAVICILLIASCGGSSDSSSTTDTTPPDFTTSGSVSVKESQRSVATVQATDTFTVTYSIAGGGDSSKFSMNSSTGKLTFNSAPDFENPADANADNVYVVIVKATDSAGNEARQTISITVVDGTAPSFTSSNSPSVEEGQISVITVQATDASTITYDIAGGSDSSKFSIDSSTGKLTFNSAPDFDNPADADADNVYVVIVKATDSASNEARQTISITVVDGTAPKFTSSNSIPVDEGQTSVITVQATDSSTITYSIAGGDDGSSFSIDSSTGELSFNSAPDFENPADANADNVYIVIVKATDATGNEAQQKITVTVVMQGIVSYVNKNVSDDDRTILHVLNRLAYGATHEMFEDIKNNTGNTVKEKIDAWIDEQLDSPYSIDSASDIYANDIATQKRISYGKRSLLYSWQVVYPRLITFGAIRPLESKYQLRTVLADFWSNHFFKPLQSSGTLPSDYISSEKWYERAFGNFSGRLGDVSDADTSGLLANSILDAGMLDYLSGVSNVEVCFSKIKSQIYEGSRDSNGSLSCNDGDLQMYSVISENYPREILELHLLGVTEGEKGGDTYCEIAPCYTAKDIKALTKALSSVKTGNPDSVTNSFNTNLNDWFGKDEVVRKRLSFTNAGDVLSINTPSDKYRNGLIGNHSYSNSYNPSTLLRLDPTSIEFETDFFVSQYNSLLSNGGGKRGKWHMFNMAKLITKHPQVAFNICRKLREKFISEDKNSLKTNSVLQTCKAVFENNYDSSEQMKKVIRSLLDSDEFLNAEKGYRRNKYKSEREFNYSFLRALGIKSVARTIELIDDASFTDIYSPKDHFVYLDPLYCTFNDSGAPLIGTQPAPDGVPESNTYWNRDSIIKARVKSLHNYFNRQCETAVPNSYEDRDNFYSDKVQIPNINFVAYLDSIGVDNVNDLAVFVNKFFMAGDDFSEEHASLVSYHWQAIMALTSNTSISDISANADAASLGLINKQFEKLFLSLAILPEFNIQ